MSTTNNAEALRALLTDLLAWRKMRLYGDEFEPRIVAALAALASQPQADGAGGDAVIERAMQAARNAAPVKADLIMEGISRDRFRAWIAAAVNETLAATPAPAVEREAVARVPTGRPSSVVDWLGPMPPPGTLLYTTPPAEAREPEPQEVEDAWDATTSHTLFGSSNDRNVARRWFELGYRARRHA